MSTCGHCSPVTALCSRPCGSTLRKSFSHVLKYVSFFKKNNDIPLIVKRRVLDAAMMSSLPYGCESWVGANIKLFVTKLYNWAIKQILGVRKTTLNLVCYAEAGYTLLSDLIKFKQHKFFSSMWSQRSSMLDDSLSHTIRVVTTSRLHILNGK